MAPPLPSDPIPRAPAWRYRVVSTPLLPQKADRFLAAELDGRTGRELVVLPYAFGPRSGPDTPILAYSWRGGRFRRVGRGWLPMPVRNYRQPAIGDLDGDGRDEIYSLGEHNAIARVRLERGRFRVLDHARLVPWAIGSLALSTVRSPGRSELLLAVDTKLHYQVDEPPQANRLIAFSRRGSAWKRVWAKDMETWNYSVGLLSGSFDASASRQLVIRHWPSGIEFAAYEVWRGRGRRMFQVKEWQGGPFPPDGMQDWIGVSRSLAPGRTLIVSNTNYLEISGESQTRTARGELLEWNKGRPSVVFTLPGEPVAVGDFLGRGRDAVLVQGRRGQYMLLESERTKP